jgi:hypothetical protein
MRWHPASNGYAMATPSLQSFRYVAASAARRDGHRQALLI